MKGWPGKLSYDGPRTSSVSPVAHGFVGSDGFFVSLEMGMEQGRDIPFGAVSPCLGGVFACDFAEHLKSPFVLLLFRVCLPDLPKCFGVSALEGVPCHKCRQCLSGQLPLFSLEKM